jgi:hypothetical protein
VGKIGAAEPHPPPFILLRRLDLRLDRRGERFERRLDLCLERRLERREERRFERRGERRFERRGERRFERRLDLRGERCLDLRLDLRLGDFLCFGIYY